MPQSTSLGGGAEGEEGGSGPLEAVGAEGERLVPRGVAEVGVALEGEGEAVAGDLWELGEGLEEVGSIWNFGVLYLEFWWALFGNISCFCFVCVLCRS